MKLEILSLIAFIIIFINCKLLISLVTLRTRKTLKILIDLKAENLLLEAP